MIHSILVISAISSTLWARRIDALSHPALPQQHSEVVPIIFLFRNGESNLPRCQSCLGRRKDSDLGLSNPRTDRYSFLSITQPLALDQFTQPAAPWKKVKDTDRWKLCPENGHFRSKTAIVTGLANNIFQPVSTGPSPFHKEAPFCPQSPTQKQ